MPVDKTTEDLLNFIGASVQQRQASERDRATKEAMLKQQQANEIAKLQEMDRLGQEETQRNLGIAKQLRTDPSMKNLGNVNITGGGGVSLGMHDPTARLAQMQDKDDDNERLETKALQDEYNRMIPEVRKKYNAVTETDQQLEHPSQMTRGQIGAALAKASTSGSISDYEQKQMQPSTAKSYVAGLVNFFRPDTMNPYSEGELKNIKEIMGSKKQSYEKDLERAKQELSARAATLAPTLKRKNKLEKTLKSLGVGITGQGKEPSYSVDQLMQRLQTLEAKRRAAGVK